MGFLLAKSLASDILYVLRLHNRILSSYCASYALCASVRVFGQGGKNVVGRALSPIWLLTMRLAHVIPVHDDGHSIVCVSGR